MTIELIENILLGNNNESKRLLKNIMMKKCKERINSVLEDKVITKEDEMGGAPMGGGEIASSTASTAIPGEVSAQPDGSIGTGDVIGHCDHQHNNTGFMHRGCLHRPFPVFTVPSYKVQKKKKIKVIDLTESDDFDNFKMYCEQEILKIMRKTEKDILNDINPDLKLEYDTDYEFDGEKSDWVAAVNKHDQKNVKTIKIAFNLNALYEFLYERGLEMDNLEIQCQLLASLYHELVHGLIQYFEDTEIYDLELTDEEEENMAEEYSKFKLQKWTNVRKSKFQDILEKFKSQKL